MVKGYEYEILESSHRNKRLMYLDFDFSRFADYLARGVWPWLVEFMFSFVTQFLIQIPFMIIFYGTAFAIAGIASYDESAGIITGAIAIPLIFIASAAFVLLCVMVMVPILLRSGLSQDFGEAFRFGWAFDFVRRVWLELTLVCLFIFITGGIVVTVGLAVFFVGVIPAMMVVRLAMAFLTHQLYELYLARGGTPVPLKEVGLLPKI